jgi:hypothetical protein
MGKLEVPLGRMGTPDELSFSKNGNFVSNSHFAWSVLVIHPIETHRTADHST